MMNKQPLEFPRLREMLECGCPFKQEMKERTIQSIFNKIATELDSEYGRPENTFSDAQLLSFICREMESFLISYRTRPVFKQQLKEKLLAWVKEIEKAYQLQTCSAVDAWPDYVEKDIGIALVKLLHTQRPGITKNKLADSLKVDPKTIQNNLRKLDPGLKESSSSANRHPLRIGGHAMHVDIAWKEVSERGDRSYYTPNTLHPLVMQLNVTQTAVLLMALQNAYDRGEYCTYCEDVALDIWCQLSDYGQKRIESIFTQNNPEFAVFLKMLKQDIEDGRYPEFKTERILAESGSLIEQLDYACKTGHRCNLTLRLDDKVVIRQKNRIFKNNEDRYFCVDEHAENPEESRLFFTEANVKTLEIV